jgi:tryptophan synthase beta chain
VVLVSRFADGVSEAAGSTCSRRVARERSGRGRSGEPALPATGSPDREVLSGACPCRGGSNFAGLAFPFLREKIAGREIDVLACEPAACPTLTRGVFAYDFGDTSKLTPLVPMHTLGHDFVPAPIHAGGLRYHGVAPLISQLVRDGLVRAEAYLQNDVFASAVVFAGSEGILPAPEAAHAIHGALQAAAAADEEGRERTILFNLSGHGHFDLAAYDNYLAGKLEDVALDEDEMSRALHAIEGLPSPA